jgi:hypothetical protein
MRSKSAQNNLGNDKTGKFKIAIAITIILISLSVFLNRGMNGDFAASFVGLLGVALGGVFLHLENIKDASITKNGARITTKEKAPKKRP